MSRLFAANAVLIGIIVGCIPIIGQIAGIAAYAESRNGNEMAPYSRLFAAGTAIGTVGLVILYIATK